VVDNNSALANYAIYIANASLVSALSFFSVTRVAANPEIPESIEFLSTLENKNTEKSWKIVSKYLGKSCKWLPLDKVT